jgi:hypothetical protein
MNDIFEAMPSDGSHIKSAESLSTFNAALTGICANPVFFGAGMQGSPMAAVEFASRVVWITCNPQAIPPKDPTP